MEMPTRQAYYHIEYSLLPDSKEPTKVDLVLFGLTAKVYTEKETRVLTPWQEGDRVWLAWSQSVQLCVTRQLLVKMPTHKITFRVWDTKDKVSTKAKYARPKVVRLPPGRVEEPDHTGAVPESEAEGSGGTKSLVCKLRAVYEKQNSRNGAAKPQRENTVVEHKSSAQTSCSTDRKRAQKGTTTQEAAQPSTQRCVHYGGVDHLGRTDVKGNNPEAVPEKVMISYMKGKVMKASKEKPAQKLAQEDQAEKEDTCRIGAALAELEVMNLLAGDRSVTECFRTCSGGVSAGLCSITLDQPLLSEELMMELNPLVITIFSASSLPSTPVPYQVLQQKCLPVYCQYSFPNMPLHKTKGQQHGSNVYFRDVNVIFTGLLSAADLVQILRGTAVEIEVHDRDRKVENPPASPAIFGTEPNDDKLASVVLVTNKCTTHNPFREKQKLPEPYGIAKLNLSDLLHGQKCLNLILPVRRSCAGSWLGGGMNEVETASTLERHWGDSMPMGRYIEANSTLKVQVEIARPLDPDLLKSGGHLPFGRIIYIFKCNDVPVLNTLRSEILRVNAKAFQLDAHTEEMAWRVLCGYRMNSKDRVHQNLNVLTGFHMVDKTLHLFVLEGLEQAIKKLWETVPIMLNEDAEKQVTVLYNSSLSFSERLYDILDVGLTPVHLHEPLARIVKEPLVYIRDLMPQDCLQAILRINHLCQVKTLEEVVQNNLFPSAMMVLSLGQEFGLVPSRGLDGFMGQSKDSQERSCHQVPQRKAHTPLNNSNTEYMAWKQQQVFYAKDFVQTNIERVQKASSILQKTKQNVVMVAEVSGSRPAHNYSVQTMNCTVRAQELLRKEMAKEPSRRFTYNQHYHSFTVAPVDVEAAQKASKSRSRAAWRTSVGFVYPGFKSSQESNRHPKQPDEARVEELRKPWRENILHGNTLWPTLNRCTWPWNQRHEDFELYSKPPAAFGPVPPFSIHLAGEALRQEQLQTAHAQYARWLKKVLPDKNCLASGRIPEFKCHMRRVGLDKLHDLLKDKPMKISLKSMEKIKNTDWYSTARAERGYSPTSAIGQYRQCHLGCSWRPHSFQHRQAALPLTAEEKCLHVFQKPPQTHETPSYTQCRRHIKETTIHH
ncbi:uncharacterized protein cfap92 isoform X2 [Brachyhypopomus gauderio]